MKRVFDLCAALVGLLLLGGLMLLLALLVRGTSRGPALFKQKRVGQNNRIFTLYKFRTMFSGTPSLSTADMAKSPKNPVTPVGKFLRRASLDELPQLWNVIKGEMSLVGPRPALPTQTHLNALRDDLNVPSLRPGITGWAQINGRDELSDEAKAELDGWYAVHHTFWLDLVILWRTIAPVATGRGNR